MAASNSDPLLPFRTYLTVFQSRAALANMVLPLTAGPNLSKEALVRKLTEGLKRRVDVSLLEAPHVVAYLVEKKFIGSEPREGGRYPKWVLRRESGAPVVLDAAGSPVTRMAVYEADMWMADPRVRSTVGVPTPENAAEVVELCYAFGLLTQTNAWTGPGQVAHRLRTQSQGIESNPFVWGLEFLILMRQAMERDARMLAPILASVSSRSGSVTREECAALLPEWAKVALAQLKDRRARPELISKARDFLRLVENTGKKRAQQSTAPGVLEHRTTPRLEWLTDFGALAKEGLARNGFEYLVKQDAVFLSGLVESVVEGRMTSDAAALEYWRRSERCSEWRRTYVAATAEDSLVRAYIMLKRPIGPVAIRDLCLVAGTLIESDVALSELEKVLSGMAGTPKVGKPFGGGV